MNWIKISMKFPGTCLVCGEKIEAGKPVLWSKGDGVKHEKCAQVTELRCMVCDGSAGCSMCEFQDICDIPNVSQHCICKKCSEQKGAFASYQKSAYKKFPILGS